MRKTRIANCFKIINIYVLIFKSLILWKLLKTVQIKLA